ncbi:MAG TPA: ABC transporter ATP-binding protein [Longimicrobiales bacterium]|nr:ABC transporter ATP-binding protein [Longimicrobiales bacterium]
MTDGLRFRDVSLTYGSRTVLEGVSLHVAPGRVTGLVGPNGAGKTSIARLATGFTLPTAGQVTMDGLQARVSRMRRGVGYAPEELPRPGFGKVRALLDLRPAETADQAAFAESVLQTLRVSELLDTPLTALSKGQWRVVLLAYAAQVCPRLLVLDEPESGLDPGALDRLAALVALARDAGAAVLLLSHQLYEVERTCDRVLFVRAGTIAAEEPAGVGGAALRHRYSEIFSQAPAPDLRRHVSR